VARGRVGLGHEDGALAVVQGVGYPNSSRSHFTSTDIWHTAFTATPERWSGWAGRALDRMDEGEVPALQRHLHSVLSREIVRDHGVMMLLGSMRAEQRLAAFLTNLSKRFLRRGYSASDFHLRMTREDIGSYLGLKLETVSRLFSQFQKDGLIEVEQKHVRILNITAVERVLAAR